MLTARRTLLILSSLAMLLTGGCTNFGREPVDVVIAGVEVLQGEGLEFRMLVKLRIQNPNDTALDFTGVSVRMNVQGKAFASGVSDTAGSVPRFGETLVNVPVSISAFRMARQAIDAMSSEHPGKLAYELTGKLAGPAFCGERFQSQGELTMPAEFFESGK